MCELYARIKALCALRGITVTGLEQQLGLSLGTISHWKKAFPKANNVLEVAKALGCSVDYLLTGRELENIKKPAANISDELTEDERDVIRYYRAASPETRRHLAAFLISVGFPPDAPGAPSKR